MKINYLPRQIYSKYCNLRDAIHRTREINLYVMNGKKPWSAGYHIFKEEFIKQSINDTTVVDRFRDCLSLPEHYGEFLDERVVEYPWLLSRVGQGHSRLLDAGSVLNFNYVLKHPKIREKDITIVTLEPEHNCYWKNRVSYLFSDLRVLPLKDDWFDEVVSISTIEHVGMDNSIYSSNLSFKENKNFDFLRAISEINRVTKPGGKVYITVPYGKYMNFGWYQQFNSEMIDLIIDTFAPKKIVETYYCYESGGWLIGDRQYCQKFEGFNIHDTKYFDSSSDRDYDPDYAACSRAIAALELWK